MRAVLGSIAFYTDYGRMMAIFKILYGHHHIWDIFGLGLKSKVFIEKKQLNDKNLRQGILTVPKYVLIVWLKNAKYLKVHWPKWEIFEKGFIGVPSPWLSR